MTWLAGWPIDWAGGWGEEEGGGWVGGGGDAARQPPAPLKREVAKFLEIIFFEIVFSPHVN